MKSAGSNGVSIDGSVVVEIASPLGGFGSVIVTEREPRIQIDFTYGLLASDHRALSATGGSVTAADGLVSCATGLSVGGYGVLSSRRVAKYRAGQPLAILFSASFTAPVALSQQLAGAFTATEGLLVGSVGTEIGVMRRQAGKVAIHRLTVTVGSSGAETITITLNGVAFAFSSGGALSTVLLAQLIAEQTSTVYTGWSATTPQCVGATVTWLQDVPAATAGAFTMTSSGAATGTFATIQAGAANVITGSTVWIARASWNGDPCDGTGASGFAADFTKLNAFMITVPFLGAGPLNYYILDHDGSWVRMHTIRFPSTSTLPSLRNPTIRVGYIAASLGSSSALVVSGASAEVTREGPSTVSVRDPLAFERAAFSASTTETTVLVLRVRSELGSTVNLREVSPHTAAITNLTSARNVTVKLYINPVLSAGAISYAQRTSESATDWAAPSLTISSGTPFMIRTVAGAASLDIEVHELEVRLEPGDLLVYTAFASSSTATIDASLSVLEY